MAKYTLELKTLIESGVNIFDFDYELCNNAHKPILEQRILDEFLDDEIGITPVEKWLQRFVATFKSYLPVYNMRLHSTEIKYNILTTREMLTKSTTNANSINEHVYNSGSISNNSEHKRTADKYDGETNVSGNQDFIGNMTGQNITDTVDNTQEHWTENKNTDGNSNRDLTEHVSAVKTTIVRYADTPQQEIAASNTVIPTWLTQYTHTSENGTTDTTLNETIVSHEEVDTVHDGTIDKTGNKKYNSTEDSTNNTQHTVDTLESNKTHSNTKTDAQGATTVGIAEQYDKKDLQKSDTLLEGRDVAAPDLVQKYRDAIINVDAEFCGVLKKLFIGVI